MDIDGPVASWPHELIHSTEHPEIVYELVNDLVAVHGRTVRDAVLTFPSEEVIVCPPQTAARARVGEGALGPVYRRGPQGPLVVPTGRVLVRFAEDDTAERHRARLASAGFTIDEQLGYAPQAAWLRHASGIGAALSHFRDLNNLPGVGNVEPQLLREADRR